MTNSNNITFHMEGDILFYDIDKSILLCKSKNNNKNRWIKKIDKNNYIVNIIEDDDYYYISCEEGDISGLFFSANKSNGETLWEIPGKSFLQETFGNHLYLIFIDDNKNFYFIKVEKSNGDIIWHHSVEENLRRYSLRKDRIELTYSNSEIEIVCPYTGQKIG